MTFSPRSSAAHCARAGSSRHAGPTLAAGEPFGIRASVDVLIAPERHEVAVEVLAEGLDLSLEAAPQAKHHLLLWRWRRPVHEVALGLFDRGVAQLARHHGLQAGLDRARYGPPADRDPVEQFVELLRAHAHDG